MKIFKVFIQEEEEVISAHRKEVEDTMEIVREVNRKSSFNHL